MLLQCLQVYLPNFTLITFKYIDFTWKEKYLNFLSVPNQILEEKMKKKIECLR